MKDGKVLLSSHLFCNDASLHYLGFMFFIKVKRILKKRFLKKILAKKGNMGYNALNIAGWSSQVTRQAHNLEIVGSNPTPATTFKQRKTSKSD